MGTAECAVGPWTAGAVLYHTWIARLSVRDMVYPTLRVCVLTLPHVFLPIDPPLQQSYCTTYTWSPRCDVHQCLRPTSQFHNRCPSHLAVRLLAHQHPSAVVFDGTRQDLTGARSVLVHQHCTRRTTHRRHQSVRIALCRCDDCVHCIHHHNQPTSILL